GVASPILGTVGASCRLASFLGAGAAGGGSAAIGADGRGGGTGVGLDTRGPFGRGGRATWEPAALPMGGEPGFTCEDSLSEGGIPELVTTIAPLCGCCEIAATLAGLREAEKTSALCGVPMRRISATNSAIVRIIRHFHHRARAARKWFARP